MSTDEFFSSILWFPEDFIILEKEPCDRCHKLLGDTAFFGLKEGIIYNLCFECHAHYEKTKNLTP